MCYLLNLFAHFQHVPGFQTFDKKERENKARDNDCPSPARVIFLNNLRDYA